MKILTLDIETTPHTVHTWGLFNQNVAISQIVEPTETLCFAAKWRGSREVMFHSAPTEYTHSAMIEQAWRYLDEADAVVTWNGGPFDLKHLQREFLEWDLGLPSPYVSIDLLRTARRHFRFASNKLDYVAQALGVGAKTKHPGFQLWLDCIADTEGTGKAWRLMERYNKQDVRITEKLYDKLLPWISNHPNVQLFGTSETSTKWSSQTRQGCPTCGSLKTQRRGTAATAVSTFQRFQCQSCGKWFRGSKRIDASDVRGV